jgi:hypothetical protein
MNRINPLHIIALLVVVLLFTLFKLSGVKGELVEAKARLGETSSLATELIGLKKVYGDKKYLKRKIEKIFRLSTIKKANITKKYTKSGVIIKSKSIELVVLNTLMGKLLNDTFHIKSFKIKRLSDKKAILNVEIKW